MSTMWNGCLSDTEYLEVEAKSGLNYGVWITTPMNYADSAASMPLLYVMDGNWAVGLTAPLVVTQGDPYLNVAPYIQVSIGYAGEEAAHWASLRNRDLVPPGEPVSEQMIATLTAARDSGAMTPEHMDAYLAALVDTHADAFLDFITEELHPLVCTKYRVSTVGHGLFGYSYGGLFALYAWLRGTSIFSTVGAGSAGVTNEDSVIYAMVPALTERLEQAPRLHLTINEAELLGDVPIYRGLARNVLQVAELLYAKGYAPDITTAMLHETHVTGLQASFLSYLKACHVG